MLGFAGWDLYGNFCAPGKAQGSNMLLKLFFGTVQNAAFGIAGQIQNAVMQFASNMVMVVRPQIIKSYSEEDYARMNHLICRRTIFISLLLLTLSIPAVIEAPFPLNLWLKNISESTVYFCRLALLSNIFIPGTMLLVAGIHATGKNKGLSLFTGSIYLSAILLSYLFFRLGGPTETSFIIDVLLTFTGMLSNAWLLHRHVQSFPFMKFVRQVIFTVVLMLLLYMGILYG